MVKSMKKMIFVLLTLLLLAACNTAVQQETQTQQPQTTVVVDQKAAEAVQETQRENTTPTVYRVRINNFDFLPEDLTVNVGDTVVWVNDDKVVHTVTAKNNEFDSLSLKQDDEFAYTFTKKGTYAYNCDVHSGMTGSVKVE